MAADKSKGWRQIFAGVNRIANHRYGRVLVVAATVFVVVSVGLAIALKRHKATAASKTDVGQRSSSAISVPPVMPPVSPQVPTTGTQTIPDTPSKTKKAIGSRHLAKHPAEKSVTKEQPDDATSHPASTTINIAPNGFAISGGNVQNPTINNYGPPAVEVRWNVRDVVPPIADGSDTPTPSQFKFEKEITVMVSAPYTPVSTGVVCDSHLEDARGFLRTNMTAFNESEGIANGRTAFVYF